MHCRAHNVPVTPLTNDASTATLSSLLSSKRNNLPHLSMKPEKYSRGDSGTCSLNADSFNDSANRYASDENSMET